jgi:hypothetical protein
MRIGHRALRHAACVDIDAAQVHAMVQALESHSLVQKRN